MLTRLKSSLTLRIFLMTSVLLIAACVVTYGAIAYLTPISYTSLLSDELNRETDALLARLSESNTSECETVLQDFARKTGADMRLTDEYGQILYDTIPAVAAVSGDHSENTATAMESADGVVEESADGVVEASAGTWSNEEGTSNSVSVGAETSQIVLNQVTVTQDYAAVYEGGHSVTFADGTSAVLNVQGGQRAVNQAAEAMKQTLPFLLLVIVGISLLGSFFYARFITTPIVAINKIAKRIAALDFGARWKKRRADEIGGLGESLNLLSDNLSATLSKLEQANQELQQDIERERELDRQRLAFFSAASHELKTPVTILKGQLSGMLAQVGVYRDREKYLARSLEVTGRMEGLIKEILTISRIESGSFALNAVPINLGELLQKQLTLDEELIEQKQLQLDTQIASDVMVQGNESLLANALDNVLMNAILYSPLGATIRVRVRERAFSVENTGVFIPKESLAQLFTPFYRVEQSRNRKSGGSGLGLYLVKNILELHGAVCSVENTEKGVSFMANLI
ncbi:MAG: HAMP domain-containing sensor histidine kinase [Clostridia bacterium]